MTSPGPDGRGGFHHEAVFHAGSQHFVDQVLTFASAGLEAGEPVMAVLSAPKIDSLSGALGAAAGAVSFVDTATIGGNPARLIPVWQQFLTSAGTGGKRCRGIGEPAGLGRGEAELAECWQHEALVNLAFPTAAFTLLCSYDQSLLSPRALESARSHHPFLCENGRSTANEHFTARTSSLSEPLEPAPSNAESIAFDGNTLGDVRALVAARAVVLGTIGPPEELVIAVNEVATNSVRHGGGHGVFLLWTEAGELVCEVRDDGRITDPLVGRRRPLPDSSGGRGLWIANQLCDLVQVRSGPDGTVVRLHSRAVARAAQHPWPLPRPSDQNRDSVLFRRL